MSADEDVPADDPATRLRDVVERVVDELGLEGEVEVTESDEELRATVEGEDLGSADRQARDHDRRAPAPGHAGRPAR